MHRSLFTQFLLSLHLLLSLTLQLSAQDAKEVTSIHGKVVFPETIPAEINSTGLSLADAVVTLEGKYNHPRMPYPGNWDDMTVEDRRTWHDQFVNSDQYALYEEKVKAAKDKRSVQVTTIAEDGTFTFENVTPSWYQLTVQISPPNVPVEPFFASARAYGLNQFFVKTTGKPHQLGVMTLKLKNVIVPGDQAPDFTITKHDGSTFKLSDLRGKYVLFDFWATWCGPCIAQMPHLESVSEKFAKAPLVTLGLSVDEKQETAKSFLKKKPSHYLQGYVGQKENYEDISTAYGIESIPSIWFVDPEGKVLAKNLMGPAILKAVEKAFASPKK